MSLYIYSKGKANGVTVIVNNFIDACARQSITCSKVSSLDGLNNENDLIIPYGIKRSLEVLQSNFTPKIALLVDAYSLGCKNKVKYYLKSRFFSFDFFYSIYGYLRYSIAEKRILRSYETIIVVSETDMKYLVSLSKRIRAKVICVKNGANFGQIKPHVKTKSFTLGILSSWGAKQTLQENLWFVRRIFQKYHINNPNTQLLLAGRGKYLDCIQSSNGIVVLGEVEDLSTFFAMIDAFVVVNPKGCGILNRVLDAFSHKVPIIGLPASFSGFPDSDGLYLSFSDYNSFKDSIKLIQSNPVEAMERAERAYDYVKKNHDWQKNYDALIESISLILRDSS